MTDFWSDAKAALGTVAPMLASAVGGPLAGTAVTFICKALGIDPATPQAQVAAAVAAASPDQLAELKAAEQRFAEAMRQLDITAQQLVYADKASARSMETTTRDPTPRLLAAILTGGYFLLLALMTWRELPPGNAVLLQTIIGALGAGFTMMLSFYYGGVAQQMTTGATKAPGK